MHNESCNYHSRRVHFVCMSFIHIMAKKKEMGFKSADIYRLHRHDRQKAIDLSVRIKLKIAVINVRLRTAFSLFFLLRFQKKSKA